MSLKKAMQRSVVEDAFGARIVRLADPAQRIEAEDMPRENRIGVGDPCLDRGHAQAAGTRFKGRPRGGTIRLLPLAWPSAATAPTKATACLARASPPSLPRQPAP